MQILVDEEGKAAVISLMDAAVKSGAFANTQQVLSIAAAIKPLPGPKQDNPPAEGDK